MKALQDTLGMVYGNVIEAEKPIEFYFEAHGKERD